MAFYRPICHLLQCDSAPFRKPRKTGKGNVYEQEVPKALIMRYGTEMFYLIRQPMQKVGFGLSPGLLKVKRKISQAKGWQETPQAKSLWKRLRNRKGSQSMAKGDDP